MKKVLVCLLVLALLGCAALAEGYLGDMVVVNCEEWVSLREYPGTEATRLAKVPLGARVLDCETASNGFAYCHYEGQDGYILLKYLEAAEEGAEPFEGDVVLDTTVNGLHVVAVRTFSNEQEHITVTCADGDNTLWTRTMDTSAGQVDCLDVFMGGTAEDPRVMLYQVMEGLASCDVTTGEPVWTLPASEANLGAGICHAVAKDGTMVIGGYFGPDPVAIDVDGHVLWRSDVEDENIFWLYEIELRDDCVAAHYEYFPEEGSGWVLYGYDGQKLGVERD